jgi:hypothetical protein
MAADKSDKSDAKKVMDVVAPGQAKPSASSRPIVVGNRSVLGNDPMVVTENEAQPAGEATEAQPTPQSAAGTPIIVNHQAKTVAPLSTPEPTADDAAPTESTPTPDDKAEAAKPEEPAEAEPAAEAEKPSDADAPPKEPESQPADDQPEDKPDDSGDDEEPSAPADNGESAKAAKKAAEEADAKRRLELDDLIASGKYALPINAVRKQRSRAVLLVLVLIILLAVVTVDVLLDTGVLHLQGIPHTSFFDAR